MSLERQTAQTNPELAGLEQNPRLAHNYYRPEEIGRLAGLYLEVSSVLNMPEPVTMLA